MDKGFSTDHLEMIKEFNPQRVDGRSGIKDYLVPEKNYSKLVRKLGNLSCGVRDLSNNNVYNAIASAWCRTCSGEERLKVAAAGYEDPWSQPAYFFAFPRDIYTIKATVKMDIDKSHEMLDKYLENLNEELKEIAKEGLSLPENIRWSRDSNWRRSNESESVKIGERMNTLRYKTITFLQNLEIATKGITGVNPWETDYDHDESFNLCSSHNTKENLNIIWKEVMLQLGGEYHQ